MTATYRTLDARSALVSAAVSLLALAFYGPFEFGVWLLSYKKPRKNAAILTRLRADADAKAAKAANAASPQGLQVRKGRKVAKRCVTVQCDHAPTVFFS